MLYAGFRDELVKMAAAHRGEDEKSVVGAPKREEGGLRGDRARGLAAKGFGGLGAAGLMTWGARKGVKRLKRFQDEYLEEVGRAIGRGAVRGAGEVFKRRKP